MVSSEIWEKHALMSFSKTHKLHSSFGLVQFCTFLKNSLVHVFPKLHSKPYYYLYLWPCKVCTFYVIVMEHASGNGYLITFAVRAVYKL